LKRLEKQRQRGGLHLGEARLWRDLHAEILQRLTRAPAGERREALRVPCSVEVGSRHGTFTARNFGPGGLGVHGEELPPAGTEVALEWISIDGARRIFPVRTRVVWATDHKQAGLEIQPERGREDLVESLYSTLLDAFLRNG
jgi:PilZ domain